LIEVAFLALEVQNQTAKKALPPTASWAAGGDYLASSTR